jgi:anti-sigma B factor antagonist
VSDVRSSAPQPDLPPDAFRVDVHPERTVVRVAPAGELDLASVGVLELQLRELRDSGFDRIVLDLRGLTFIDSSGIALIVAEDRHARDEGQGFTLIDGPPAVRRVLEICGLVPKLPFEPQVAALRCAPDAAEPPVSAH